MSDEDEWYSGDDRDDESVDGLLHLLASKTPVERLREEVQEHRAATSSAYKRVEEVNMQVQAATAEFQRQQKLLHSKQKELAAAQQAVVEQAVVTHQATHQQYITALRKSRQGMSFAQWLQDGSKNKDRYRLYEMYKKIINDKLDDPMKMPAFAKYPGEK